MAMKNVFKERNIEMEILADLADIIIERENRLHQDYRVVEENYRQRKDWRTDELLWEDEEKTIPKMEDRYDYVDIPDDELDDDTRSRIAAYRAVLKKLEKLM